MRKVSLALIAFAVLLNAQVVLDEIYVTSATKSKRDIDGVSSSIIVITKDDIEKSGSGTVLDILRQTPSIILQGNSFSSASSKNKFGISIRGLGSSGTLLLIDGKRVAGEVKNPYEMDRIPSSIIERIEIIKAPSSALYGSDAFGGVINIITKQPVSTFAGSVGVGGWINHKNEGAKSILDTDINGKTDRFSYFFSINFLKQNGYEKNKIADVRVNDPAGVKIKPQTHPIPIINNNIKDFYDVKESQSEKAAVKNFNSRLEYEIANNAFLGVDISYMNEDREGNYIAVFHPSNLTVSGNSIPVFNTPVNSKDDNSRLDIGVDLKVLFNENTKLYTKIYQSRYKKRNDTTALNWQDLGYFSQDDSSNSGMNANVKITSHEAYLQSLVSDAHLLTTGFEYRDEDRDGTSFNQAGTYERRTFKYKALYLQDEWSVADRFNLTLGARYDDISNSDNKITFKVGANYELDNFVNLRAGFSQGYRVADTKERYISKQTPTGLQLGSDVIRGPKTTKYNLKPESINAYEIGLGGRDDKFGYDLAIFYNDVKDRIEMVNKGSYFTFENIDDSYTYGFEGSISHDINRKFATDFSYIYIKSENKQTKKDLLLTPKHSLRVALKYKPINNLSLSGDLRYVGKQDYEYTNSLIQNVRKTSEGVFYVDANINYKTDNFLFHGSVENIFGGKSDDNFFVDNGRVFYAGIRYYF